MGVNKYESNKIRSLAGCLTDVELQRELLVHRYGFNPADILIVSDTSTLKPTQQNILEAFETHLINQAKSEDVVVFHFSGHGSLIRDPNPLPELIVNQNGKKATVPNLNRLNGTTVPFDRFTHHPDQVQDIMGRTLFLLTHALKTEHVTLVLDSCHSGGGTRGNLQIRAIPFRLGESSADPSPVELEYQKRWMKALNLSEEQFNRMRQKGIAKGVAIDSANYDQQAFDAPFGNEPFYAGAFTYLLTRYLWQQSVDESLSAVFVNLARSTRDLTEARQEPIYAANPDRNRQKPVYFVQPSTPFAEAVVRSVETDQQIQYWLGGISSLSLNVNQAGTIFSVLNNAGKEIAQIEQTDRRELLAIGRLKQGNLSDIVPRILLRERIRRLPTDLKLRVGLDPSLGQDLASGRAALQQLDRIEVVESNQSMHYRLGRMTSTYHIQAQP